MNIQSTSHENNKFSFPKEIRKEKKKIIKCFFFLSSWTKWVTARIKIIKKKLNKPLANSPFQTKNLAILWAASDFPRHGGPTIVTTRGALKGQGTAEIMPVKLSAKK